ncbi:Polysaccharide deacetylase [Streptomyces clavuligerus]|uniref:Polysaccharide deacetylase n=2 Tax=Streptomyces clavuligerus TaxID=1901 RepID=E2PYS5_STRCL|nr:Polysaccharide deacetylase [Streptomyces clavuligerus]
MYGWPARRWCGGRPPGPVPSGTGPCDPTGARHSARFSGQRPTAVSPSPAPLATYSAAVRKTLRSTRGRSGMNQPGSRGTVRALLALGLVGAFGFAGAGTAAQAQERVSGAGGYAAGTTAAEALRAELGRRGTAAARSVCYRAHVTGIGWLAPVCNGGLAGSVGGNRAVEAVEIATSETGGICAGAHLADLGWERTRCAPNGASVTVGTTGESRAMEALTLETGLGAMAAQGHVQDLGWMEPQAGLSVTVGTTGRHKRLEAIRVWV